MSDSLKGLSHDSLRCKKLFDLISTEYDNDVWEVYNREINRIAAANMKAGPPEYQKYFRIIYSSSIVNFGYLAMERNNYDAAEKYYRAALELQLKDDFRDGLAGTYTNLGYLMRHRGNTQKALDYYYAGLKINEAIKSNSGIATCYNNIGYVHETQEEYEKALECFYKAADLYKVLNDKDGMATTYSNIGSLLTRFEKYTCKESYPLCYARAIRYFKQAIVFQRELKNMPRLAGVLNTLGGVYYEKGDPLCTGPDCAVAAKQNAYMHLSEALKIRSELRDTFGLSQSYYSLAIYMLGEGRLNEALENGLRSITYARRIGIPEQIGSAAQLLKNVYQKQRKFEEAIAMYDLYHKMQDSINNEATRKANIEKQFKVQYEIQAAKDSLANAIKINTQKLKHDQAITQQRTYTYGGFIGLALMLVVSVVSFRAYKNKQKANVIITKQKQFIEQKQKEIVDSINYAKRIQNAHLPQEKYISKKLNELKGKSS